MALYTPHSIFHLARLLCVRPETFGPYYVQSLVCVFPHMLPAALNSSVVSVCMGFPNILKECLNVKFYLPLRRFHTSAILLLLLFTVREYTLRCCGGLQRHNFSTKFRENLCFKSWNWRNTRTHDTIWWPHKPICLSFKRRKVDKIRCRFTGRILRKMQF